jgi:hypothetical protein
MSQEDLIWSPSVPSEKGNQLQTDLVSSSAVPKMAPLRDRAENSVINQCKKYESYKLACIIQIVQGSYSIGPIELHFHSRAWGCARGVGFKANTKTIGSFRSLNEIRDFLKTKNFKHFSNDIRIDKMAALR